MAQADFAALRPHLDDLASDDAATRLNASRLILLSLNKAPTSLVEQVLDRLFNGLASGRKSARIGFSITLAEVGADPCCVVLSHDTLTLALTIAPLNYTASRGAWALYGWLKLLSRARAAAVSDTNKPQVARSGASEKRAQGSIRSHDV